MKTHTTAPNYKGFRFPSEMISHAVWLYFRFSLSYRDVEDLLAQRGIIVTGSVRTQNTAEKTHSKWGKHFQFEQLEFRLPKFRPN